MIDANISKPQLRALQSLWAAFAKRDIVEGDPREARLAAVGKIVGREIRSFSNLSQQEARQAIDALKKSIGQRPGRRMDRDRAQALGTEGRRGRRDTHTIASAEDFARLQNALDDLGWDHSRLDAWLRSPSSPLGVARRSDPTLRTQGDINRVCWPLERMLRRSRKQTIAGETA